MKSTRVLLAALAVMLLGLTTALAQQKPNILVIFADDVGIMNLSAYHGGMTGGSTPNLGRIANEGALFTDY
jgi:arylsulfatase